ncbi:radical SAM protein [Burkholderia pseudomallei]|uniref:radical SAM protein n=1 Tax=Burkholderia pseudomallei TaxID=28450 RepID=UPI0022D94107|nr:radical SAM protein [Burkholderia pseudomallei]MDA0560340.1 radical SAM protein [Burkholderia pseudomallei]
MSVQWVIKASKLCNLRCQYCYEFPHLADARRLEVGMLEAFFRHVAQHYAGVEQEQEFVWHGGEPLLLGQAYFEAAFELQRRYLVPAGIKWSNSIQTNLTSLDDERIALLKRFANVGVSLDVIGGLRVNAAGRDSQDKVLECMQRLFKEGIDFGCIAVLSRANVGRVAQLHTFFSRLGLSYRLLPIYRTGYPGQHDAMGIRPEQILEAYKTVFDLWCEDPVEIQIRPIEDFVTAAVRRMMGAGYRRNRYIKKPAESLFIVDTDGGLYSNADAYMDSMCYGNITTAPLSALLESQGYRKTRREREDRSQGACAHCSWHGACSGFYISEATPEQRWVGTSGKLQCLVVRPMLDYVWSALTSDGSIMRAVRSRINLRKKLSEAAQY